MEAPDTRKLWNTNARAWTELLAPASTFIGTSSTRPFLAMLPAVSGLVGLDLGCGEGHNTRLLAASGADVVALDLSEYFIESAAGESRRGIRFVIGDGATSHSSSTFDFATAFMSLMDVGEPERDSRRSVGSSNPRASCSSRGCGSSSDVHAHPTLGGRRGRPSACSQSVTIYEGPLTRGRSRPGRLTAAASA